MGRRCVNQCEILETVPMNHPETKKYCTVCAYNIVTSNIRCPCCRNVYRVKRRE